MASLAKITAPKPSRVHARERLFALLDAQPIAWIHGPPGAGKTTLIASYLESRSIPSLWYQIDEGDADIATFFYYFGLAAAKAAPRRKKPLPLFTPEFARGLPAFTRRYFEEFYSRVKPPFAIVLDNYQDAPGDSILHEVIRDAVESAPPGIAIFAASRSAPPPAFARLRANGAIDVIEWEALRLTADEAQSIVRLRTGHEVSADLLARTEGWAAGLTLLLAGGSNPAAQSLDHSTPQQLFDYFAAEIFEKTDRKTQDFLMETAFLPRVGITMAKELTAHRDAETILGYLTDHGYFTTSHGQRAASYQYHPLFREFLISRARELFSQSRLTALMNDTARLLGEAGLPESAVELWRETGNWQAIAKAVTDNAAVLLQTGRHQTLEAWLAACSDSFCDDHPWLLYWRAMAKLPFDPAHSQPWFERAHEQFRLCNDRPGLLLSWAATVLSIRFNPRSDASLLDGLIVNLEKLLEEDASFPSEEIEYQVSHSMYNAMFWRAPQHPDFARWKKRALELARSAPQGARLYTLYMSVIYELMTGHFAQARYLIESLAAVELRNLPPLVQNLAHLALAYYQRETGQNDACLATVNTGLEASRLGGVHLWDFYLLCQGAQAQFAKGDLSAAEALLNKAATKVDVNVAGVPSWYHYLKAYLERQRGDKRAALLYAETAVRYTAGWLFFETLAHISLGLSLWDLGKRDDAERELSRSLELAHSMKSDYLLHIAFMLDAKCAFEKDDRERGIMALRKALPLGREHAFMNILWDSDSLVVLCAHALEAGIETGYVRKLIRGRGLTPPDPESEVWPWPIKITTLGSFNVEKDGAALEFPRKAPKKTIALLKAIIAFGRREVPQRYLIDALWPDDEGDAGQEALNSSVHRLRKLLGDNDLVVVQEGCISLDANRCWVDAWAFERLVTKAETALGAKGEDQAAPFETAPNNPLSLYRGAFLAADLEEPWALSARERLRAKFIRHIGGRAKTSMQEGRWEDALDCYQRGLEADDLAEEFYQGSMCCYRQLDRRAEALAVYRRMRQTLSVTLGIQPSPASEALYQTLRA